MSKMILFATNPEDIKMISNLSTLERRSTRDSATSMVGSDDSPSERNSPSRRLVESPKSNSAASKHSSKGLETPVGDSSVYCTRCKGTHGATEPCQEKEETESVQDVSPTPRKKSSTRANEEVEARMMMLDKPMGSFARAFLNFLTFIAELLLVGILAVTLFWVFHYEGGVAWKNDVKRQFNLHFILMIGGFIFLNGQAILAYRLFSCVRRIYAKLIHAFVLIAAAGCIAVGFYMAYEANDRVPKAMHFYTLHSWLAIGTCALFALQFIVGFMSFLVLLCCDGATSSFRAALVPVHATFGLVIFSMAAATAVTGLMQTARARLNGVNANPDYREFPEQGLIINAVAAAIILLVVLIPLITRNNIRGGRAVFASE